VKEGDLDVGVEAGERALERLGPRLRLPDEGPHLGLPEVRAGGAGEAPAEPLASCDADACAIHGGRDRVPLENLHPGACQHGGDLGLAPGVVVVVAEDGDDRDLRVGELRREDLRLGGVSARRHVACEQQEGSASSSSRSRCGRSVPAESMPKWTSPKAATRTLTTGSPPLRAARPA
jgi:hypothetical protein